MSTISWWAARTALSTCHVVMEGAFISNRVPPERHQETGRLVRPTEDRVSNKYSPLTSHCNTNPTLDLLLFEVSLLPSHPVFLFRLSVVFVKVVQHKQGTHAGETNHFFPVLFFSSQYVSVGERVCLQSVVLGRIKTAVHSTMFSFKRLGAPLTVDGPLVKQKSDLPVSSVLAPR